MQKNRGRYKATSEYKSVVVTDITFICIGTPSKDDGSIDLSFVESAAEEIGKVLKEHCFAGTAEGVVKPIIEKESGKEAFEDFGLAMVPEFLREGSAVEDFFNPDRIVLGVRDERTRKILEELYSPFNAQS